MRISKIKLFPFGLVILLLASIGRGSGPAEARDNIILTLSVSTFVKQFMNEEVIARFEATHPGVDVVVVGNNTFFAGSPASDVQTYLSTIEEQMMTGDVVAVNSSFLTPEAIRGGFYLDLTPLTSVDSSLNASDFLPVAWQSFQWNNGVWGLPLSVDPVVITYEPEVFDRAGVPYPDGSWTMDDFEAAIRQLAQIDASGTVTVPGMTIQPDDNVAIFLRALLGSNLIDDSDAHHGPAFDNPVLESLLERWYTLLDEGLVSTSGGPDSEAPLRIGGADVFFFGPDGDSSQPTTRRAPLPGGVGGVSVDGLVVSAGTQYPQLAYELAKYLTSDPEATFSFAGGYTRARQSLVGSQSDQGPGFGPGGAGGLSEADRAVIDAALANGLPLSEVFYFNYLPIVLQEMADEGLDARTALQEVEAQVLSNLQAVDDHRASMILFVNTPASALPVAPGEIALNFGIVSSITPLPNQQEWDQLAEQFAANDPEVGRVDISTDFGGGGGDLVNDMAGEYECFILPNNAVPGANLENILNLDPFLLDDSDFDMNDVVGNVMAQVQRDNRTWAYPLEIIPQVIWYDPVVFSQYGLYNPANGWTPETFTDTLRSLQDYLDEDAAAFSNRGFGSTHLLMLIAAYGGLPIDFRTSPPTINFTDPATVEAIRQVLDLAKDGLIAYQALDFLGGGRGGITFALGENQTPIYSGSLDAFSFGGGGFSAVFIAGPGNPNDAASQSNPYQPTTFPRGSLYTPVSYDIGTGYISANARNPAACYRWLAAIARQPGLLRGMPARRSLINDPAVAAAQGDALVNFYNQYAGQLQDPTAVVFSDQVGAQGVGSLFYLYWLNRAFDRYVLEDADLEIELTDAEALTGAYLECIASIPPYDAATYTSPQEYSQLFIGCATRVEPDLASVFN